eukprot:TRINITY_DN21335_c0_g2_i1.p1 TRINITY_DN21335_c0_g2~~TRINITY_DN21335_c0_g2_i1.p1  ORF type:complete len:675 (+),score=58.49 TRINITY_DN21335_c0_g2_i1:115-2139(+)
MSSSSMCRLRPPAKAGGPSECDCYERYQDLNMIFVGHGDALDRLVAARLNAGGRCVVLLTDSYPAGSYAASEDFVWQPPDFEKRRSLWCSQSTSGPDDVTHVVPFRNAVLPGHVDEIVSNPDRDACNLEAELDRLRRKFGDYPGKAWCKKGPDIVLLEAGSLYWVATSAKSQQVGVRVTDEKKAIDWEVSGEVIMTLGNKGLGPAGMIDVEVRNPFAKPFAAPSQVPTVGWGLYFLCMQLYVFGAAPVFEGTSNRPPIWKLPFPLMVVVACGTTFANTILGTAFFGDGDHVASRALSISVYACTFTGALLMQPLPGHYLSDFLVGAGGTAAMLLVSLPACCVLTKSHRKLIAHLPWGITVLGGTLGAWLIFYALILLFLYASSVAPIASMIIMPLATSATETGLVTLSTFMYTSWVYRKRLSGDQSMILSVLVCVLHGYAESARFASTLVSAASTGDYMFLIGATLGITLNSANRLGWSRRWFCLLADLLGFTRLRNILCPCAVARVHDEAKFHFGYVRFITPVAIMGADVVHGRHLLFNMPALMCFVYTFFLEMLEDMIVHKELVPRAPSPKMFDELYSSRETLHPKQLYVRTVRQQTDSSARPARAHALQLHGMRPIDFMSTGMAMSPTSLFTMCLLQLYMGAGFMAGVCESPISSEKRFEQAFIWERPFTC